MTFGIQIDDAGIVAAHGQHHQAHGAQRAAGRIRRELERGARRVDRRDDIVCITLDHGARGRDVELEARETGLEARPVNAIDAALERAGVVLVHRSDVGGLARIQQGLKPNHESVREQLRTNAGEVQSAEVERTRDGHVSRYVEITLEAVKPE